ncbi:glycoside hydrolase family 2 protein [Luteimicrobium subarcticum]|uniref:beta-mannosidase n=1 Tax=Luteimicrobium subarcticum TaxID=620910 RepID=A0A2M8W1F0_9MICO|nr:glycoside hydrolase family 2 protein [Luteimicrobium subarcticum]PJI84753.1 beta-mannosidase [Luteimicrobium subarcticum]
MINGLVRTDLTSWTVRATRGPVPTSLVGELVDADVPAVVPGTSHTALLDAGLIVDPYVGTAEDDLAWMRHTAWSWSTPLTLDPAAEDERVDLLLEGVDTCATVRLGDRELGRTANMHRSYRYDVRDLADGTERVLVVDIEPAVEVGEAEAARIGARPAAYPRPINMVRKMACSFGWDWGPDLETAGLWKPVRVERWRIARIAQVRPVVAVADDHASATVTVHVDVERSGLGTADDTPLTVRAALRGAAGPDDTDGTADDVAGHVVVAPHATTATLVLDVDDPQLWWPVGHGDPVLHDLTVEVATAEAAHDTVLDRWSRRVGLRTVTLDTGADEHGTRFTILVNGEPVFVRGANWIPDDHLLTRITRERLAARVDQALGAHMNLLRVWGGGIYESDDFYDVCDERGVLVWQDFLLACAAYPEEEPHRSEMEAEARENVVRLMPHASLVLWNGGNENLWGFMDWGWQDELDGATWGYGYYTELFPSVVAELDPSRPYSAGSPYSPGAAPGERHPNDPDHGTHHEWEVWNRVDYHRYRDDVPRFCSEFGFQAPPTWATLERAVQPADGTWSTSDPVWRLHQKAEDGDGKLDRGMAPHLGVPDDFDTWAWAAQLNQARAVTYAVEHYRSWWPRTAGAIVWQLNDCWPVTSWAAVDGDGRPKPLWHALARAYADRAVSVHARDGALVVAVVNDTAQPWEGALAVARTTLAGHELAARDVSVSVAPRSVAIVPVPETVAAVAVPADEVLTAVLDDVRTVHLFAEDVDVELDPSPLVAGVRAADDGVDVLVAATSLARGVTLLVDRVAPEATVDSGVVDLAAGWTHTFRVRGGGLTTADAARLVDPRVLRTANAVVATRLPEQA